VTPRRRRPTYDPSGPTGRENQITAHALDAQLCCTWNLPLWGQDRVRGAGVAKGGRRDSTSVASARAAWTDALGPPPNHPESGRGSLQNLGLLLCTRGCRRRALGPLARSQKSLQHLQSKYFLQQYIGHYDFFLECCDGCQDSLGFVAKGDDKVEVEKREWSSTRSSKCTMFLFRAGDGPVLRSRCFTRAQREEQKVVTSEKHGIWAVEVTTMSCAM
jgi:hypothetical protein